jgi:serine/threonine protein kinase
MAEQVLVDRYEIRQQLGKRAGRQTSLAWDLQNEVWVVVKLLTFNQDFVWDDLKLFEREAETLRTLSHPRIPRYLDFFELNQPHAHHFSLNLRNGWRNWWNQGWMSGLHRQKLHWQN